MHVRCKGALGLADCSCAAGVLLRACRVSLLYVRRVIGAGFVGVCWVVLVGISGDCGDGLVCCCV